MNNNRNVEKFLGEEIFTWEGWDEVDTGKIQFYDVEFSYESMKEFNGNIVVKGDDGSLDIYDKDEESICRTGLITDIPEFREALFKKYK